MLGTVLDLRLGDDKNNQRGAMPAKVDVDMLPKSFDARKQWPKCAQLIGTIREQSSCGSCWAVAVGSMVSDRLCIRRSELRRHSPHPDPTFMASEADILACSGEGEYVDYDSFKANWFTSYLLAKSSNFYQLLFFRVK